MFGVAVGAVAAFVVGVVLLRLFPVKEMTDTDADAGMMTVPGMP